MSECANAGVESEVLSMEVACLECGRTAQRVELVAPGARHPRAGSKELGDLGVYDGLVHGDGGTLVTAGVMGKGAFGVESSDIQALREAFRNNDMMPLLRKDSEWVPSYCVNCGGHYCTAHWLKIPFVDECFYDYTEGICPKGHKKILDD